MDGDELGCSVDGRRAKAVRWVTGKGTALQRGLRAAPPSPPHSGGRAGGGGEGLGAILAFTSMRQMVGGINLLGETDRSPPEPLPRGFPTYVPAALHSCAALPRSAARRAASR